MMRIRLIPLLFLLVLVAPASADAQRKVTRTEKEKKTVEKESERKYEKDRDADADWESDTDWDDGGDGDFRGQARSSIDTTVAFSRDGVVDLSLISGTIDVTSWSRNEAKISASSERGLIHAEFSGARLALKLRTQRGRSGMTRYEVTVPVGARVITNAVSGDIQVTGTKGDVEAHAVSGDIEVRDAAGRIVLESVSGDVTGEMLNGDVSAEAVSGDISLERVNGELTVETVSGEISLPAVRSKFVRVESVSGTIEYSGSFDAGGRYEFHAHSGDLRLTLPGNAGARISIETFSGGIESVFPITLQPGARSRGTKRMEFSLGSAGDSGARVIAETFSGDIYLERAGSTP